MSSPDDARLAALEKAVAALRQEVAELRASHPAPAPPALTAPLTYANFAAAHPVAPGARPPGGPGARPPRPTTGARAAARAWLAGLGVPELPTDGGFETLVGRYGAVAVGALVLLMGVGAFLTWAVENFTLTPAARVLLGALGAAALAALGERLRRRAGAERFGEVLLALALAVVHVDAWAAGPYLRLVSAEAALGVAAVASLALTALAWRARQQSLFVVGVGGALLAPFVSGAGETHPLVRPAYGWVVLTAGLAALVRGSDPQRPWRAAARLLGVGAGAYAVAQLGAAAAFGTAAGRGSAGALARAADRMQLTTRVLPPAFALACAAGPLALLAWHSWRAPGRRRAAGEGLTDGEVAGAAEGLVVRLALAYLTTAAVVLWGAAGANATRWPALVWFALAATLGAQAVAALPAAVLPVVVRPGDDRGPRWPRRRVPTIVLAAFLLPLATLGGALAAYGETGTPAAAGIAALWAALSAGAAAWAWQRSSGAHHAGVDPRLGPHLAAAGLAGAMALALWSHAHDALRVALFGLYGAGTAFVFDRAPGRGGARDARPLLALAPPVVVLVVAAAWGATLLHDRAAFAYTPFLTAPSGAMALVTLGWVACAAAVWRSGNDLVPRVERAAVVAIAVAVALLWGREELARVGAPDLSTFLLVGYWALAGVALIAVGRARRVAAARQAGLALALYAALKAIVEVSQLDAVALRVGSYLLVGGFLLGVGYWYRAAGGTAGREPLTHELTARG